MKRIFFIFFLFIACHSCKEEEPVGLAEGFWLAELEVGDNQRLPFNFKLIKLGNDKYNIELYNADETIIIDEIKVMGDSVIIKMPVFEGYLAGKYTAEEINGKFVKENEERVLPFKAVHGIRERFKRLSIPSTNISGDWEVEFRPVDEESYMAKGIFKQVDDRVSGTFRTMTGDYRYLEGIHSGDSVKFSTFDGARAYLFQARATDSSMVGVFYSGKHAKETFVARRNENYELPNTESLTYMKKGFDKLKFSFPDSEGNMVSLDDANFKDKVVIVQIMGTWCPNCLDETKFLAEYLKEHSNNQVAVIALAFEYAKTKEAAFKSIDRLEDRIGIKYPILLAQYGTIDKKMAQMKLPMLNHVLSFPTTVIIDKNGDVRKIYTGFNGPATGSNYESFKKDFHSFITQLLEV
ncbi:TlpA family protein disulfide reductase [Arenibacter sp. BSSL-BM3]|uniref:TlpA family protein disulfide reductase n=1 Tax=Arenibacter arenosicollis TaxID=2762274 RepID=A0ABR7QQN5_9FLAO|nr:TlpA disulfide reductase family protein [Arenibacter arenosicollis]MBC8769505.1 TlpA family protein disulfide reductase [Arenibacter arenosicollis]